MLRHTAHRAVGYCLCCADLHSDPRVCSSVLHSHHQDHSTIPLCPTKEKSLSTCSSHMTVVSITYGSCIFVYVKPSAKESVTINKGVAVLMSSIAPMLNPFIYTLRNKQVRQAFSESFKKNCTGLKKVREC